MKIRYVNTKVYQGNPIEDEVHHFEMTLQDGTEFHFLESDGEHLKIHIDGALVIHPNASNAIELSKEK